MLGGDSRYNNISIIHSSNNNNNNLNNHTNNYTTNNNENNYNIYNNNSNHMPSVSSNTNPVSNGSDKIIITDDDRTEEYEIKQEPEDQLSAHILDHQHFVNVHQEDGVLGVGGNLPPVTVHRTHNTDPLYSVNGMGFLVNSDDADMKLHHPHQQHNGHHITDYGKVSIASITGAISDSMGSDKANISSLVNENDVGEVGDQSIDMGEMVNSANLSAFSSMGPNDTTTINGIVYNSRGYEVCGQLNQHSKPCQRIGRCPFHSCRKPDSNPPLVSHPSSAPGPQSDPQHLPQPQQQPQQSQQHVSLPQHPFLQSQSSTLSYSQQPHHVLNNNSPQQQPPISHNHIHEADHPASQTLSGPPVKKAPYKQGWTKDEHVRFLNGLQIHGKGAWKEIAQIVGSRTPTQIQSHAQKYYLRQKQEVKNKRSIHDLSLEALSETDNSFMVGMKNGSHQNSNFHLPSNSAARTGFSGLPYSSLMGPISQSNSYVAQNPQDPSTNQLGLLFSSFYRAPGSGSSSNSSSTVSEPNTNGSNVPPLISQPYPLTNSTFRAQPPPPMAPPVFSNSSLHSNSILPHVAAPPPHHNSLPPLTTNNPLSHSSSTPFPSMQISGWFNSTFSSSPASKLSLLPEFDDDDSSVLAMDDLHPSSNSVRNLISINDDDHPPLTHHLTHYAHDVEDDKLNFSSSYLSIPNIPRIDEDSNELPPLTGGDQFGRRQMMRHRDG